MPFHRHFWIWIQSTAGRWGSWKKPWPGAQLCRLSIWVSAAPCPGEHPFLQFLPNIWEGWAGLPPPIPLALHKAHANNHSCLIVSKRIVHKLWRSTLPWIVLKAPRAKGAAGIRNQSNSETRTKGQVCSLPPDWCTSPVPGNQIPHPQAKQGQALQSRSEEIWARGTWKGTTAAGGWWKEENKALNKSQAHNSPDWLPW